MLLSLLLAVYEEGWNRGAAHELSAEHRTMLHHCLVTLAFLGLLYLLCNLLLCCSFLNHFAFSHAAVADHSFGSALVLILCAVDATCLNLLAQARRPPPLAPHPAAPISTPAAHPSLTPSLFGLLFGCRTSRPSSSRRA